MPPDRPQPRTIKARTVWSYLDEHPNASLTDIEKACDVQHHCANDQRKAWRAAHRTPAPAAPAPPTPPSSSPAGERLEDVLEVAKAPTPAPPAADDVELDEDLDDQDVDEGSLQLPGGFHVRLGRR